MSELESKQFIFGCIFLLSNKLQLLGDQVTESLTLKQWLLLNMIKKMGTPPPNLVDISRVMGTSRQNVSKMLGILEKKGMVALMPSPLDQRAVVVVLTEACEDYFTSKENAGNELLETLFAGFSAEELQAAATVLGKLFQNTEKAFMEIRL